MTFLKLWPNNIWREDTHNIFQQHEYEELIKIGQEFEEHYPLAHVPRKLRSSVEQSYNLLSSQSATVLKFKHLLYIL